MNGLQVTEIIDLISAALVSIAVVVSGIWGYWLFVQNRQRYPRASITHSINLVPLAEGKRLLHVTETIRNEGDVLLSLECMETRIQQMDPPPDNLLQSVADGQRLLEEGETEYPWPMIGLHERRWEKGRCEIEPNESQDIHHDFVIGANVRVIEVYSYMKNFVKRKREIGWNLTTVHELYDAQEASSREEGSKR
ncbi:MAG: hypothetical protein GWN58_54985 [Anaerolineae bacterium]|nr:hypothetical protein [Anaerolineae bacterium]